jgi:hypothetical protein
METEDKYKNTLLWLQNDYTKTINLTDIFI